MIGDEESVIFASRTEGLFAANVRAGTSGRLATPQSIQVAGLSLDPMYPGNLLISDERGHRVYSYNLAKASATTLAGSGRPRFGSEPYFINVWRLILIEPRSSLMMRTPAPVHPGSLWSANASGLPRLRQPNLRTARPATNLLIDANVTPWTSGGIEFQSRRRTSDRQSGGPHRARVKP